MAVRASVEDERFYKKIEKSLDTTASFWTFASEGLKTYKLARAQALLHEYNESPVKPGTLSKVLAKADKAKKYYEYVRRVEDAVDETKRDGALLKLGIKISMDLAKKWLGASLTTHPYYAYHKVMLDALADALNAAHNSRSTVDAYRRAVSAATSTAVAKEFKRLEGRKVAVVAAHVEFTDRIGVAADIARGLIDQKLAERKIQQYGGTARIAAAVADLQAWRAMWAGLACESMKLVIMAGTELNVAAAAMHEVQQTMAKLMGGGTTSVLAGRGAINAIEWEKYDQIVNRGTPDRAAMDPVAFAQSNHGRALAWTTALAEMCDFVTSDEVYFPSKFNAQLERLNKVLYVC